MIGCFFRRPGINDESIEEILKTIKRASDRVECPEYGSVVIFGDFNYPEIKCTQYRTHLYPNV